MEDPLLRSTTTTTTTTTTEPTLSSASSSSSSSSSSSILGRLAFLLFLASAALFASYEASKSFEIVVASSPFDHSLAARRYRLSFVSNGRATRIVLDAARHVNELLQLHLHPKKPIHQLTIQLATHCNLTQPVAVAPGTTGPNDYIISLSPTLFLQIQKDAAGGRVEAALRRGMARVSIWDGEGTAPTKLVDALTEVLSSGSDIAGREPVGGPEEEEEGPCWAEPGFLKYYEERRSGFLGRLNKGMKEKWRPGVVAEAIGAVVPEENVCGAYYSSISDMGLDQIM